MRKGISLLIALSTALVLIFSFAGVVLADGPTKQAGKSHIGHLYLYEKDAESWEIVDEGSWGKMRYVIKGDAFNFVFNGHGLESGSDYCLIYYPDPWPGEGLICLGSGTVNEEGNIHIAGTVDTGDLPAESDENEGAKIWLVLSSDVDCENQLMIGWNPTEYLFEYDLISFNADDEEAEITESSASQLGNDNKPEKPAKPEKPDKSNKSNNGKAKGKNK